MSFSKMVVSVSTALVTFLLATAAFAEEELAKSSSWDYRGYAAIGAGIAIAGAVLGGALGQGRAASGALEGLARNPQASKEVFLPFILALALIESLVLMGFVIAYFLVSAK
jgi:F-type H+-transporting ATPase subunit c